MNSRTQKALSMLLAATLSIGCSIPAMATDMEAPSDTTVSKAIEAANNLHTLGLFGGVGTNEDGTVNFDLDRSPTRHEAITMLVRLLGKENEAKTGTWETPFTDVVEWAQPYVGYAYTNGLTGGISPTEFGGQNTITATQYLTFILRAMGYQDGEDFEWSQAWLLSDKLGITDGTAQEGDFLRGDVAEISLNALTAPTKTETTLATQLVNAEVFTAEVAKSVGIISEADNTDARPDDETELENSTQNNSDLFAVKKNNTPVVLDPKHPNGENDKVYTLEEAGEWIKWGAPQHANPDGENILVPEMTDDMLRWSRYVQVTDDRVGYLKCCNAYSFDDTNDIVTLYIPTAEGETVTIDLNVFMQHYPDLELDRGYEKDKTFAISEEYAHCTLKNGILTYKITDMNEAIDDYLGTKETAGILYISPNGWDYPSIDIKALLYKRDVEQDTPSFNVVADPGQIYYFEDREKTSDCRDDANIWDANADGTVDLTATPRTGNVLGYLRVYPNKDAGVPSYALTADGYVKKEYLPYYYTFTVVDDAALKSGDQYSYGEVVVVTGGLDEGSDWAFDRITIRTISRLDGTAVDTDILNIGIHSSWPNL